MLVTIIMTAGHSDHNPIYNVYTGQESSELGHRECLCCVTTMFRPWNEPVVTMSCAVFFYMSSEPVEEFQDEDTCLEATELLLIGCSTESIWTPKSKSNMLTPKTNSQTSEPKEASHVMSGTEFLDVFLQPFSFEPKAEGSAVAKPRPMNLVWCQGTS